MNNTLHHTIAKYLRDHGYVTEDQAVTQDKMAKLRAELQATKKELSTFEAETREALRRKDNPLDPINAELKELQVKLRNLAKQTHQNLRYQTEQLHKELAALKLQVQKLDRALFDLSEEPQDLGVFRLELNKRLQPIQKIVEKTQEQMEKSAEVMEQFEAIYSKVLKSAKKQRRQVKPVTQTNQPKTEDDNKVK